MKYTLQEGALIIIDGEALSKAEKLFLFSSIDNVTKAEGVWFNFTKRKDNPELTLCLSKIY